MGIGPYNNPPVLAHRRVIYNVLLLPREVEKALALKAELPAVALEKHAILRAFDLKLHAVAALNLKRDIIIRPPGADRHVHIA